LALMIVLCSELKAEVIDIFFESLADDLASSGSVIICIGFCAPQVEIQVWHLVWQAEFSRDDNPIFCEVFEPTDKIDENATVRVDEPIELVAMGHGMETGAAAVLQTINKLVKSHLLSHLFAFAAFVQRHRPVPRVSHRPKLEILAEQISPNGLPNVEREEKI